MAKNSNPKPKKPIVLNEVSITATRLGKASTSTRLYPRGEVSNAKLDSVRKANPSLGKAIGQPVKANKYTSAQFGANQSDLIKSAIKPKKKK